MPVRNARRRRAMNRGSGPRKLVPGAKIENQHFDGTKDIKNIRLGTLTNKSHQPFLGDVVAENIVAGGIVMPVGASVGTTDLPISEVIAHELHAGSESLYVWSGNSDNTHKAGHAVKISAFDTGTNGEVRLYKNMAAADATDIDMVASEDNQINFYGNLKVHTTADGAEVGGIADKATSAVNDEQGQNIHNAIGSNIAAINAEQLRAETKELVLEGDIGANAADITAEQLRAETKELVLEGDIGANAADITAEQLRAETAELGLTMSIGALTELTTTAKNTVVAALNEHDAEIGNFSILFPQGTQNPQPGSLVGAINQNYANHQAVDGGADQPGSWRNGVKNAIDALVDGAPAAVDTLKEIQAQINDDTNGAGVFTNSLIQIRSDIAGNASTIAQTNQDLAAQGGSIATNQTNINTLTTNGLAYGQNIGNVGNLSTTFANNATNLVDAANQNHADITNIKAKTDHISVSQAVNLDTMETGIETLTSINNNHNTDINNIKAKTNHITVTQDVDLDTLASNVKKILKLRHAAGVETQLTREQSNTTIFLDKSKASAPTSLATHEIKLPSPSGLDISGVTFSFVNKGIYTNQNWLISTDSGQSDSIYGRVSHSHRNSGPANYRTRIFDNTMSITYGLPTPPNFLGKIAANHKDTRTTGTAAQNSDIGGVGDTIDFTFDGQDWFMEAHVDETQLMKN